MPRETFRKQITSPELWQEVDKRNKKLLEQFLKEKNTRNSDSTLKGYKSDLEIFFTWNLLNNKNKFFIDIKKLEFSDFFSFVSGELQWGSARFTRVRSVLSSLSNFIEKYMDDDYPGYRNLILKVIENMPKVQKREKTILSEDQVNTVFNKLEEFGEWQISCWFALAIGSGSRFSELLRFTVDNINENNLAFNDLFLETLKPIKTKGRSKAGKMLIKYIVKYIFWDRYKKWIEIRKQILDKNNKDHNFIFIKSNGDIAQESTVRGWVAKIEDILEIPFYPHVTRHYLTTYLSKAGIPYTLIKELFGWADLSMCGVYDDTVARDKKWAELDNLKETLDKNK